MFFGLFTKDKDGKEMPIEIETAAPEATPGVQPSPATPPPAASANPRDGQPDLAAQLAETNRLLAAERQARIDDRLAIDKAKALGDTTRIKSEAKTFASGLVDSNKLLPAGASAVETFHAFANLSAAGLPTEGLDLKSAVSSLADGLVPHRLTDEALSATGLAAGVTKLAATDDGRMTAERKRELLASHPLGELILADMDRKN